MIEQEKDRESRALFLLKPTSTDDQAHAAHQSRGMIRRVLRASRTIGVAQLGGGKRDKWRDLTSRPRFDLSRAAVRTGAEGAAPVLLPVHVLSPVLLVGPVLGVGFGRVSARCAETGVKCA